jgi:hypothetical protein
MVTRHGLNVLAMCLIQESSNPYFDEKAVGKDFEDSYSLCLSIPARHHDLLRLVLEVLQ